MKCADGCLTAIVASIGKTLCLSDTLERAMAAGALSFRLPLGLRDRDLTVDFRAIREASRRINRHVDVLLDLPASRPRVGTMAPRWFAPGESVRLIDAKSATDDRANVVPVPGLGAVIGALAPGQRVLFRDGRQQFRITAVEAAALDTECTVCTEPLNPCNGCSFPDSDVRYQPLLAEDLACLESFATAGLCPDWVMVSFANAPEQVVSVRTVLGEVWPRADIQVMAKIETAAAVEQVDVLLGVSDGLLLGRGDLALSLPAETLPQAQAAVAEAARHAGKPLLVATQLLEVFARTGEVYRAELSDVALAVRQGVAGLVLCAETNDSPRPVETIDLARRIISAESGALPRENRC